VVPFMVLLLHTLIDNQYLLGKKNMFFSVQSQRGHRRIEDCKHFSLTALNVYYPI
jgi:hypothetical protein